jgi:PAS domain S-box-containing protein
MQQTRAPASVERFPASQHVEGLLAAIVTSSDDAIVSKNLNGTVTSWNPGAEQIFGYLAEEMIGRPITTILPPERMDEETEILRRIRAGERVDHFETVRMRKDGSRVEVSVTISPIRDSTGRVVGASKVARNISAQKQAQRMMEQAQNELKVANDRLKEIDRLKSDFLASMSHELRTPLNSIIGFTGILRQQIPGPLNEEQAKQLGMIANSSRHLLRLIDDILDLSRIEAGRLQLHPEPIQVREVVEEALKSIEPSAAKKDLRLINSVTAGPDVVTDRKLLLQVMLNLLSNAVKFTESGEVAVSAEFDATSVRVTVADTGIGIKPDDLAHLFEAFRQLEGSARRRYEGTGLGLHLSKRMLEVIGGTIGVESALGSGSRFSFVVPRQLP